MYNAICPNCSKEFKTIGGITKCPFCYYVFAFGGVK